MKKVESYRGKEEGTYDYATGERADLKDGYMVTFHQNEPDEAGHYKSHYGRYTEEEYDRITNEFAEENAADVYIGVFDGEPEISFKVKTFKQAKQLAIEHNQQSVWKNKKGEGWDNPYYNVLKNPMRGD